MKRILFLVLPATVLGVTIVALEGACNNVGDCSSTANANITQGGTCSGDNLQCPYTLQTPNPACDGTDVEGGIATSCVCTGGTWVCPDPIDCGDSGTPTDDGGDDGAVDDSAVDGGGDDGAVDSGGDGASAGDAEAGSDATTD